MSNLLKVKLPYVDQSNSIEDTVNYMVKTINSTSKDEVYIVGDVVHSSLSEADFYNARGKNWSKIGSSVIGTITVNIFIKIN